jgi:uncharacterized protein
MVPMRDIQALADEIVRRFAPDKIILFGSHACDSAHQYSDVDLLIVTDRTWPAGDADMAIWAATRPPFPVDFLVKTPAELDQRYRQFNPVVREAVDQGKVLYDRPAPGA